MFYCKQVRNSQTEYKVVEKPEILFARIDEEELKKKLEAEEKAAEAEVVVHKPEIEFPDFDKVELRVGEVTKCEKHPEADKLLVFQIDFGDEQRQILSGIAMHYKPEELVGKHVIAVTNLKPRKMRGLESNGMLICATKQIDGKEELELLTTKLPKGSIVC